MCIFISGVGIVVNDLSHARTKGFKQVHWRIIFDAQNGFQPPQSSAPHIVDDRRCQQTVGHDDFAVVKGPQTAATDTNVFDRTFDFVIDNDPITNFERAIGQHGDRTKNVPQHVFGRDGYGNTDDTKATQHGFPVFFKKVDK